MLYQLYEAQRALLSPFAEFASATSKLYDHPLSPFAHTPGAHRMSAGLDLIHRLSKDYEKPPFGITSVRIGNVDVAVQEQVTIEKPFCRLLRFKRFTDDSAVLGIMKDQPVVLVVAPLSGHHSTLLRETVRELLRDHKVYITDWTDARMVPLTDGPFHLDDYVAYVQEFIRHLGPAVNVMSVCQPTVPVLAAISLMASAGEPTPRTMTMMGGPIDARKSPTAVNNLATTKSYAWFETNVIYRVPVNYPGSGRRVYPGFLQHTGFIAMNPDRHLKSHYDYFLDLMRGDDGSADFHRGFYDEYNAVLDMPAEYYLDTIKVVFQDFALVNGTWRVHGELVRPQDIRTTALLTIEGELDDISGAGQTRAAHVLCTGISKDRQFHYDVEGAGHYGIFSGRRWREKVYPQVRDFIALHQSSAVVPAAALPSEIVPESALQTPSGPTLATTDEPVALSAPVVAGDTAPSIPLAAVAPTPEIEPASPPEHAPATPPVLPPGSANEPAPPPEVQPPFQPDIVPPSPAEVDPVPPAELPPLSEPMGVPDVLPETSPTLPPGMSLAPAEPESTARMPVTNAVGAPKSRGGQRGKPTPAAQAVTELLASGAPASARLGTSPDGRSGKKADR